MLDNISLYTHTHTHTNTEVHVSFLVSVFLFFRNRTGTGVAGSYDTFLFSFLRTLHAIYGVAQSRPRLKWLSSSSILFSILAALIYNPTNRVWGFPFFHILTNICYLRSMRNAGKEEAQTGIKIARRNINNIRYANDTTLMVESKEELKSLSMKVKEGSEKAGLKINSQ